MIRSLEVGVRTAMVVLQALGTSALRPGDTRCGIPGGVHRRYGARAGNLLQAYSLASNTQLRLASLYDSRWDFTLYSEGFLALQGEYTNYIGVDSLDQPAHDGPGRT